MAQNPTSAPCSIRSKPWNPEQKQISPNVIDPAAVGVVDEEVPDEVVHDKDQGDVQGKVGDVAQAVLNPDPVQLGPEGKNVQS